MSACGSLGPPSGDVKKTPKVVNLVKYVVRANPSEKQLQALLMWLLRSRIEKLVLDTDLKPRDIGAIIGVKENTISKIGQRASANRLKMSPDEIDFVQGCVVNMRSSTVQRLITHPRLEIMVFPGEKHSAAHVAQIINFIKSAQKSLCVSMYVLTHGDLCDAILSVHKRSLPVKIHTDHTQMHCVGSKIPDLVLEKVEVFVDNRASYMQHHKYVIVDDFVALHGSVNFSQHAMVSGGLALIHEDKRLVERLITDFCRVADPSECHQVTIDEVTKERERCKQCEEREKAGLSLSDTDECVADEPLVQIALQMSAFDVAVYRAHLRAELDKSQVN